MKTSARFIAAICGMISILTACHGGSSSAVVPQLLQPAHAAGNGDANFAVAVAANGPQSLVVSVVDANGQKTLARPTVLNLTAQTPGCSLRGAALSCNATIAAPAGTDDFSLIMYSAPNGAGAVISSTQATAVVTTSGKTSCVPAAGSKLAQAAAQALGVRP